MAVKAKYLQIVDWVEKRISIGELTAGDKLESENEISAAFGFSRQTVRHALGIMENSGILKKVQGSGTYVTENYWQKNDNEVLLRSVTIISTYADGYIFLRIIKEMVKTLEENGYSARIMFTGNRLDKEKSLLKKLLEERNRDPLIVEPVMSALPNPNLQYYRRLRARGIPILFFHTNYQELDIPCVAMNDIEAGHLATEYLISQGHRSIGGIFKLDDGQGRKRYQGMIETLYDAEIDVEEKHICWIDSLDLQDSSTVKESILKRLKGCTACVCYNDEVAHMLTDICLEKGIRIPEDLSLISVDNSELARLNSVPLTSVAHPMEKLGRKAAESILKLIENPRSNASYLFSPQVEVRSSVKKIEL